MNTEYTHCYQFASPYDWYHRSIYRVVFLYILVNYPHQWIGSRKPDIRISDDDGDSQVTDGHSITRGKQLPPLRRHHKVPAM